MNLLGVLIPIALGAGILALAAFLWSVRSGQYEDLDGAAHRILLDDEDDDNGADISDAPGPANDQSHRR